MPITLLTDEALAGIRDRAAGYDRDNAFPHDDLAALADLGYLRALVPAALGGHGLTLREAAAEQQRLAAAAPATALAVNMHLVWTAVARLLHDAGDESLDWLLREAANGEIFAFGVSEPGNDLVLFGSQSRAEPASDGGYRFTGTKVFTSLSPVWTRLGTFALDSTSPDAPKLVWGFVERGGGGIEIADDWDTMGMRATQSQTTRMTDAPARADRIVRRLDPGPNADPLVAGIFAAFETLVAAVYTGIAGRGVELAVEAAHARRSLKNGGAPLAHDPEVRGLVAEAAMAYDALPMQVAAVARDLDERVDHGAQAFARVVGLKTRAVRTAQEVLRTAVQLTGGSAYRTGSEVGRLWRDVQAGGFHPSSELSAHGTVATAWLGPVG